MVRTCTYVVLCIGLEAWRQRLAVKKANLAMSTDDDKDDTGMPTTSTTTTSTSSNCKNENENALLDLIVVGGGVVGLAIARHAAAWTGCQVAVVEQEADLLVWASGRNSGIICTGVDAAIGTLERALIRDSLAQLRTFYRDMNLPLRDCGSLVCQWDTEPKEQCRTCTTTASTTSTNCNCKDSKTSTDSQSASLQHIYNESHDAGDNNAQLLTSAQVLVKEPHLNPNCRGAVHIPGEIVVDPWLHGIAYAVHARQNGASIYTNFQVDMATSSFDPANKIWTLRRKRQPTTTRIETSRTTGATPKNAAPPTELRARVVVNAAGLWADLVQSNMLGGTATNTLLPWEARPRRGQYRVFQYNYHCCDDSNNDNNRHNASPCVLIHPIQPIPTSRTKGVFVFSTLYNHIVVGPTATNQTSRTDRSIDPNTAQELENTLHRVLTFTPSTSPQPSASESHTTTTTTSRRSVPTPVVVGDYVGIRPGSNHRDYQIHLFPNQNWLTCAGIRSTGLTASLGIGRHVVQLLQSVGMLSSSSDRSKQHSTKTVPLPPVAVLAQAYRDSGNRESIAIDGYEYRVTHPLTQWGWAAGTGLAAPPRHVEY